MHVLSTFLLPCVARQYCAFLRNLALLNKRLRATRVDKARVCLCDARLLKSAGEQRQTNKNSLPCYESVLRTTSLALLNKRLRSRASREMRRSAPIYHGRTRQAVCYGAPLTRGLLRGITPSRSPRATHAMFCTRQYTKPVFASRPKPPKPPSHKPKRY